MSLVAITGASGAVGSSIVSTAPVGSGVLTLGRNESDRFWDIEQGTSPDLSGISAVIHCAWIVKHRSNETAQANVGASARLLYAAQDQSARFIFISSMTASPTTRSIYGRTKYEVEKMVEAYPNGVVIKPGLVRAQGQTLGMMSSLLRVANAMPVRVKIAPDPLIPVVSDSRLVSSVWDECLRQKPTERFVTLVDEWVPLSKLLDGNTHEPRHQKPSVAVPRQLISASLKLAAMVPISKVRDAADSWTGLMDQQPDKSP